MIVCVYSNHNPVKNKGGEGACSKSGGAELFEGIVLIVTIGMPWALVHGHLGGLGACSPRKFWKFRLSENVSEAFWQLFLEPINLIYLIY